MSPSGLAASLDGALNVASSNVGVLTVTPLEGGLFRVDFIGAGEASLLVSGDADLGEGVTTISQGFDFVLYDPALQADHFDLTVIEVHDRESAAAAAAEAAADTQQAAGDAAAEDTTAAS